jgi:predicted ATPase
MTELALKQPELVGREEELIELKRSLDKAIGGEGSTMFISGEAGIGKTRIVNELNEYAKGEKCNILQGWCFSDSLNPLMPVHEAFRRVGIDHLFSKEKPPKLECVYLVNNASILLSKVERTESQLDADLFTAMLSAVGQFVKDSIVMFDAEQSSSLNVMGFGDYKILIEQGTGVHIVAILTGRENEFLINDLRKVLREVETEFGELLKEWDGDMTEVKIIEPKLRQLITSGKYEGIDYTADDPKLLQENLFDNILLGLQRLSSVSPVLFFLDDLQWADPTTLSLSHYLSRNTRNDSVLIVGTYRPEDIIQSEDGKPHPLDTTMQEMNREGLFEKVELDRLDLIGTNALVKNALGNSDFDDVFMIKIFEETGGTPLFVLEVVKLLVEVGSITQDAEGAWRLQKAVEKVDIPSKVFDVVKRRLDRLEKDQLEMLEYAAVIGEEFTTDVLERTTEMNKLALLRNLSEIQKRHNLIHYLEDKYKFDHTKIREVLYNGIGEELRREFHRMIGDVISELYKEDYDEVINDLAYHFYEAGDERAREFLIKAGDKAKDRYANFEALRLYRNAEEVTKDVEDKVAIWENIGDLLTLTGEFDSTIQAYEKAEKASMNTDIKTRMMRKVGNVYGRKGEYEKALEAFGKAKELIEEDMMPEKGRICVDEGHTYYRKGDYDKAIPLFTEALEIFEGTDNKEDLGKALRAVGNIYLGKGEYDDALRYYEKSLDVMEDIEYQHGTAAALNNIGNVYFTKGEMDKALEYYEKCYRIIRLIGDKSGISLSLNNIGVIYENKRDLGKALEYHKQSLEIRERIGDKRGISFSLGNIGIVYQYMGQLEKALEYHERSREVFEKTGQKWGLARSLGNIGIVHTMKGELDKALDYFRQSYEIDKSLGDKRSIALSLGKIGGLHKLKGELNEALELQQQSLDISEEIGEKQLLVHNHCGLAEVHLALGENRTALEHARKAGEISADIGAENLKGSSHRTLGMVHRENESWDMSVEEFEKGRTILEKVGDKGELAKLYYEYGLLWKTQGNADKARENIGKALEMFEKMSMRSGMDDCKEILNELEVAV